MPTVRSAGAVPGYRPTRTNWSSCQINGCWASDGAFTTSIFPAGRPYRRPDNASLMPAVSVITCTHNPRTECLSETLASLQAQTLPKDRWELLVLDNASREPV